MDYTVSAVPGIPEVAPGDDVAALIGDALDAAGLALRDGDILCVTSKILSKAEGRLLQARDREAAIDAETVRLVARRGTTRIVQTRHGFVMAAAGVDASNTAPGTVLLLPEDPDASARRLADALRARYGVEAGVVVTDTFGRPWREGQTDVAIGAAYVSALTDHRGSLDTFGNELQVTAAAVADELAGAGEVVKGKADGVPVALIRGVGHLVSAEAGDGVRPLIRSAENDMFSLGTSEAIRSAVLQRRTVREFSTEPVSGEAVRRAVAAALTAPASQAMTPWRVVLLESETARKTLLNALAGVWHVGNKPTDDHEALRQAPYLAVPCVVAESPSGSHDARRSAGDLDLDVASAGAALQNFLVTLAAEGLGSLWVTSAPLADPAVRQALELPEGWAPLGVVAVGKPARLPAPQEPGEPEPFLTVR